MEQTKVVNSSIIPNTWLTYSSTNCRMVVNGRIHDSKSENADYIRRAIEMINSYGIPSISDYGYRYLKSAEGYRMIKLFDCFYLRFFNRTVLNGSKWGHLDGHDREIELSLVARWDWSISNYGVYKIKGVSFESKQIDDFFCTSECRLTTTSSKLIGLQENITIDKIGYLAKLIVASYIHELVFFESLEGRVFNGGHDIDDLINYKSIYLK